MINYHLTITGRVQGVGFRWSVYQLAQQAGIEGIVMNKNDGSVYCELQGPIEIVKQLIFKTYQNAIKESNKKTSKITFKYIGSFWSW